MKERVPFGEINGEILKTRMLAKSSTGDSLLSFSLSYTFSDSSALAFSQLAGESPRSLDRTMLFSSPQLDGGIKSLSARFIRCSGSARTWPPNSFIFHSCCTTYKNLSNEITDRQPERENYKMKHWGNSHSIVMDSLDFITAQSLSNQTVF